MTGRYLQLEFSNPKAAAELPFAWPVDAKKYHVKVTGFCASAV